MQACVRTAWLEGCRCYIVSLRNSRCNVVSLRNSRCNIVSGWVALSSLYSPFGIGLNIYISEEKEDAFWWWRLWMLNQTVALHVTIEKISIMYLSSLNLFIVLKKIYRSMRVYRRIRYLYIRWWNRDFHVTYWQVVHQKPHIAALPGWTRQLFRQNFKYYLRMNQWRRIEIDSV